MDPKSHDTDDAATRATTHVPANAHDARSGDASAHASNPREASAHAAIENELHARHSSAHDPNVHEANAHAASVHGASKHDYVPPLLRGLGFMLVLITSLVVGVSEHRADLKARERMALIKAHIEAEPDTRTQRPAEAIAHELRMLRLQMQEDDLADRVFENRWFQLLGALSTALVAASFLVEARMKWVGRGGICSGR